MEVLYLMLESVQEGIWMNLEKGIKIKKVRVYATNIKRLIDIRKQRDKSPKEYKRQYHVSNDDNYMMGIYVGQTDRGRQKADFELISTLEAVNYYNSGVESQGIDILPPNSKNGFPIKWKLKIGTMVLLYETTQEEIFELSQSELCKRLYRITGLTTGGASGKYGEIAMVFQHEARPKKEIEIKNGRYKRGEDVHSGIRMLHTQFKALVQGQDFDLNDIGEITFK